MTQATPRSGWVLVFGFGLAVVAGAFWLRNSPYWRRSTPPTPPGGGRTSDPTTDVKVVDAATGQPIRGAIVVFLSSMASSLGQAESGSDGVAHVPIGKGHRAAVGAWHPDYSLCCEESDPTPQELRLAVVPRFQVSVSRDPDLSRTWHREFDESVGLAIEQQGNPVRGGKAFLATRLYRLLGLQQRRTPLQEGATAVPRYLELHGTVQVFGVPKHQNRLDDTSMRRVALPATPPKPVLLGECPLRPTDRAVEVKPRPQLPNALIVRYHRRAQDRGEAMLHLSYVQDRSTSPSLGSPASFVTELTNFRELDGELEFSVFDLPERSYTPTLLWLRDGKVEHLPCRTIAVRGVSRVDLVPAH
ncbi:MAG: hypothetical protein H6836_04370 [Planctomycetes bacterium]|nr:hypothetical protein [Planctomycetota bacterium]MCB9888789.1 hypothetical protein [Planctomycetota bacterium]